MNLEKLANRAVVVLNASDTLNTAIQNMWHLNIRHLPVMRSGVLIGMVSERDVLLHVCWPENAGLALASDPNEHLSGATRVDEIMAKPVIALSPEDVVEKAARLMVNKRIGAVPVATGSTIFGIVTETDFLKCFTEDRWLVPGLQCRQRSIVDHMSTHVFAVAPEDATLKATRLMRDKQVRHVAVVRDETLVGIVSDRDVLRGGPRYEGPQPITVTELRVDHHLQVKGIMSTHLEVLDLSATLADAAQKMVTHKIGATPVVNDGKLVGILTETDLLRAFIAACEV